MTIITKPITEKKIDGKGPLLDNETPLHVDDVESQTATRNAAPIVLVRKRVPSAGILCVLIAGLLAMIAIVYWYQEIANSQKNEFKGWCQIPIAEPQQDQQQYNRAMMFENRHDSLEEAEFVAKLNAELEKNMHTFFDEHFEIDLDNEQYENIDVPDFDGGRRGRFIHDFHTNKTGIIDLDKNRCFVMPLNRENVLVPRSLYDLIQKMWGGYYDVDTERVRETMRVITPPVTDLEDMGSYIQRECKNMDVYRLERYDPKVVKRSVPLEGEKFVMFAGKKTLEIDINYVEM